MITVAEADNSGLRKKLCEFLTECRVVYDKVPAGLVNVARLFKRSTTFGEQLNKSDQELRRIHQESQVVSGTLNEAQHLDLTMSQGAPL